MSQHNYKRPPYRRLRGFAFDPSLSYSDETAEINDIVFNVPWEDLEPGPVGEYIEVVDYDPTTKHFYKPVDLNDVFLVAQDGLTPSESDPQFHQQMVYAVAMVTIKNFETALGRKINWSPRLKKSNTGFVAEYVPRLRLYPHAMREANAYYTPYKKAILFGYFHSIPSDETLQLAGVPIFTCLSHDIIAHEVTHAILDNLHMGYQEATNLDVLAFHEAFADIVALFQHFSFPEALQHQIAKTQGDLSNQNLLGQLAQEFGAAIGNYGSLRDALGSYDPATLSWRPHIPDPQEYREVVEPHERGSILVAAIFEAFITIYKSRVADIWKIASYGAGRIPEGELPPELTNRLAAEAAIAASEVLTMCIRALDYCPPMDITFGDYLCAIITADIDATKHYNRTARMAFINAFRKRGIFPQSVKAFNEDSLRYPMLNIAWGSHQAQEELPDSRLRLSHETTAMIEVIGEYAFEYAQKVQNVQDRQRIFQITQDYLTGKGSSTDKSLFRRLARRPLLSREFSRITGLAFAEGYKKIGIAGPGGRQIPSFRVSGLQLSTRAGRDFGQITHSIAGRGGRTSSGSTGMFQVKHVMITLQQRCGVRLKDGKPVDYFDPAKLEGFVTAATLPENGYEYVVFRGGCTFIFDLDNRSLKYIISKPIISEESLMVKGPLSIHHKRLNNQLATRRASKNMAIDEYVAYFGADNEPFAFLHQG